MQLLHWLGSQYLTVAVAPGARSPVQWHGEFLLPIGRTMICFPEDYDRFLQSWQAISSLQLDKSRLILVARKPYLQGLGRSAGEKRIPYETSDVNVFGLAKKTLAAAVRKSKPAVAIDLHTSSIPLGAHLALRSGAPLRVCLAESPNSRFFNMVVRGSESSAFEDKIRNLFRYLGMVHAGELRVS